MKTIYNITFFLVLFTFTACDIINPAEDTPSYIYIPEFQLNTNSSQGTNAHKITDVWVTVGTEFLGVYPLPALVPILAQGDQDITLEAGIKENGIAATGVAYPFYQSFQTKRALEAGKVDTLRPAVSYQSNTKFTLLESFESNTHAFRTLRVGNDFNRIQIVSEGAFQGNSARLMVNKENPAVEIATNQIFNNPGAQGVSVFLEVNYKAEAPVLFGIVGYKNGLASAAEYRAGFAAKEDWNKIYFNLTPLLAGTTYDTYQVVFQTVLPSQNNVFTQEKATIWLDNIKLVHF